MASKIYPRTLFKGEHDAETCVVKNEQEQDEQVAKGWHTKPLPGDEKPAAPPVPATPSPSGPIVERHPIAQPAKPGPKPKG